MRTATVLVCDDEPHILHVVSTKLRNAGFEVLTAMDGQEALDLVRQHKPDLIVTDYQMPILSGLELCTQMRSEPETANIPALMLTARGFVLNEADLQSTNIQTVLPKPFSPREVLQKVKDILGMEAAAGA